MRPTSFTMAHVCTTRGATTMRNMEMNGTRCGSGCGCGSALMQLTVPISINWSRAANLHQSCGPHQSGVLAHSDLMKSLPQRASSWLGLLTWKCSVRWQAHWWHLWRTLRHAIAESLLWPVPCAPNKRRLTENSSKTGHQKSSAKLLLHYLKKGGKV